MLHLLKRKSDAPSKTANYKQYTPGFHHDQKAVSFQESSELRQVNVPNCAFGASVSHILHSNQMVGDVFLKVKLADSDSEYCKRPGLAIVKSFSIYYQGAEVQDCPRYDLTMKELFENANSRVRKERRDQLLELMGPAAPDKKPGTVLVYLPCFWTSIWHRFQQSECWSNNGSSKLEFRIEFSDLSDCGGGTGAITSVDFIHEELLVSTAVRRNITPANQKSICRPEFWFSREFDATADQLLEIPLHDLLAYGNVCQLSFHYRDAAKTGKDRDILAKEGSCKTFKLAINGQDIEDLDAFQCPLESWLQNYQREDGESSATFRYSFGGRQTYRINDVQGFLPSSFDQMTVQVTPSASKKLRVVATVMKQHKWSGSGVLSKRD